MFDIMCRARADAKQQLSCTAVVFQTFVVRPHTRTAQHTQTHVHTHLAPDVEPMATAYVSINGKAHVVGHVILTHVL
jgi:hypothetical protein